MSSSISHFAIGTLNRGTTCAEALGQEVSSKEAVVGIENEGRVVR